MMTAGITIIRPRMFKLMGLAQGNLPLRKDGQIETRPLHVEEWLETLPYADFQRTGRLLHEAIAATNKAVIKPGIRQELHGLYDQPYRYYLESQISAGAQHTLASMESMQQQLQLMKQLAADLAYMTQLLVNDAGKHKSLWGKKPPMTAAQQAMSYLSQALIFNFLEYRPTPRNVWKQLHRLYRFAESMNKTHLPVKLPDGSQTTIAHTYCRILLTELVDPYHLPFGGIWEVYEQVNDWLEKSELVPFQKLDNAAGQFVIDLDSDMPAIAYDRFDMDQAGDDHRILDARTLYDRAQQILEQVQRDRAEYDELKLSIQYRRLLLGQMSRAWYIPPKRYFPRSRVNGEVPVACGLKPAHFHMNGGRDALEQHVSAAQGGAEGLDVDGEPAPVMNQTGSHYTLEQWSLNNQSSGGCALSRQQRPLYSVRVGDLVGLNIDITGNGTQWQLGLVRWLMIDSSQQYRLGIQLLGTDSEPVTLHADGGEPVRGFRIRNLEDLSVVTERGVLKPEQNIAVNTTQTSESLQIRQMIEEMAGCERFSVRPLQP